MCPHSSGRGWHSHAGTRGQKLKEELTNVGVIVVTGYCLFIGAEVIAYEQRLCYCWHGRVIPRATCLLQSFSASPCSSGKRLSGKMVMGIPLSLTLQLQDCSLYLFICWGIQWNMSWQKQQRVIQQWSNIIWSDGVWQAFPSVTTVKWSANEHVWCSVETNCSHQLKKATRLLLTLQKT